MERFVEAGLPAEFLPGEVRLEGSLLLEEMFKKGVVLEPGRSVEGAVVLSAICDHGSQLTDPLIVPARVTAGTKFASFNATLKGSPLQIATCTEYYAERSDVQILFDIKAWHDCDLRLLPHFDRIQRFLEHAAAFSSLEMRLEVDGNQLVRGISANGGFAYFKRLSTYLEIIRKARFLAGRYNLKYDLFRPLTASECDDIEELYDLLTLGEANTAVSHWTGEGRFSKENWEQYQ